MKILVINGPNINMLGKREPEIYGTSTLDDINKRLAEFSSLVAKDVELEFYQSNIEGEIVSKIQSTDAQGLIINPAGYTHTSVAIPDAIKAVQIPAVEVHLSNIQAREDFRKISYVSPVCLGTVAGFGEDSYKEFEFLKIINNVIPNKYLGNDCAYLDEYSLALSQDTLVEDVHFSSLFMTPYEIAVKSLLVNISDILASGAVAKYFSISLSGKLDSNFIEEFYRGLDETAKLYNIKLIGGDLTKSDKIIISITILGDYKERNISLRSNAKEGYIVAVKGEFGSSAQGLYNLQKGIKEDYFSEIHKKPVLYPEISSEIALKTKYPYAMMDSSDGLFDCLYQIASKSKVRIDADFSKIPRKTDNKDYVLYGGEDYSLVVVLDKKDFDNIEGLTQIGSVSEGSGVYIDNVLYNYKSFEHFK